MATFVKGEKTSANSKEKVVLSGPEDLIKWISKLLTREWDVSVYHKQGSERLCGYVRRVDEWWCVVRSTNFHELTKATTLVGLAKRFQQEIWPLVVAERERRDRGCPVKVTPIDPQRVSSNTSAEDVADAVVSPAVAALPAPRRLGIPHKQAALPAPTQAALTGPDRQPSLFPGG